MTNHTTTNNGTTSRIHAHDISTSMTADQAGGAGRADTASEATDVEGPEPAIEIDHNTLDLARHDCTLTITNPATGGHRTFRIRTVHNAKKEYMEGKRLVELLTGPDNSSDYLAFAFIGTDVDFEPGKVRVWRKFQGTAACKSEYEKFADILNRQDYWASRGVQFLASLRCRRCGRKLTTPDSIRDGLGPICRDKM
jgi:hypothetical protein